LEESDANQKLTKKEPPSEVVSPQVILDSSMAVPGIWTKIDAVSITEINEDNGGILSAIGIPLDNVRIIGFHEIALTPDLEIKLRHCVFVDVNDRSEFVFEVFWFAFASRYPFVLAQPGLDLTAMLTDVKTGGVRLDFRDETRRHQLAAITLLFSDPPRFPLPVDLALPTTLAPRIPRITNQKDSWRRWQNFDGAGCTSVELPWIEGADLVRGRVLVPHDGLGCHVFYGTELLTRCAEWAIPVPHKTLDGAWSAFRHVVTTQKRQDKISRPR
jgi:hypothetical protein